MSTHTFTIATRTETRSNRRDRSYVVSAETATVATFQVEGLSHADTRSRDAVATRITDDDGLGAPADCLHMVASRFQAFAPRWDGGRNCQLCAGQVAS